MNEDTRLEHLISEMERMGINIEALVVNMRKAVESAKITVDALERLWGAIILEFMRNDKLRKDRVARVEYVLERVDPVYTDCVIIPLKREPCPPYKEKLHPRSCLYRKPYWMRIRSNPYRKRAH